MYGDTGMMETECAMAGVWRHRGIGDGRSDVQYIFGRPCGRQHASHSVSHITSCHYTLNYTLYGSHFLMSLALSETPCGYMQLDGSSQPGSIIHSYPLRTLLEPEPVFLTHSFCNGVRAVAKC